MAAAAASSSSSSSTKDNSDDKKQHTFAAAHYPLSILSHTVHILSACGVYVHMLQQLITSSNASDLSVLVNPAVVSKITNKTGKDVSDTASTKSSSSASSSPTGSIESFADFLAPSLVWSEQHVPHGTMKSLAMFRYLTPHGVKTLTAEGVAATLKAAKMPYVTDLIRFACVGDEDAETAMYTALREMRHTEVDVARFCLCALFDLAEKGVFGKLGDDSNDEAALTPLAKRDMKKALSTAAAAASGGAATTASPTTAAATNSSGGASKAALQNAAAAAASSGTSATIQKDQKQLRQLLEEEATTNWPFVPVEKSVCFTIAQDPNQPRHKPLFKSTVVLSQLKNLKVDGEWCGTKRDADNSAAAAALPLMRRMAAKK